MTSKTLFAIILALFLISVGLLIYRSMSSNMGGGDKGVTAEELEGEWEVAAASRDQKATKMLDGAQWNIGSNPPSLTTDWLGSLSSSPMVIEKGAVVQSIPSIRYEIVEYQDSILVVKTQYRRSVFEFLLKRKKSE